MAAENSRVLIIEDDPALGALLKEYLDEAGYEIFLQTRGDSALDLLNEESFDLVLSDIVLPGADGIAILRQVTSSSLPEQSLVILMTGYSGIDDALHAVEQGAYDFVSKPFRLPEIRVRLDNARRFQQLLRQLKALNRKGTEITTEDVSRGRTVGDRTAVRAYIRNEAV